MNSVPRVNDDPRQIVLMIDDSEDMQRVLRVKLRNEDVELVTSSRGEEGLAKAKELRPATILLDLDMPGMDGLSVIRRLKEDATTQDIPVIVVSALSSPADKVAAFELGAVDYITKPFEFTELRVRLRSALSMHRLIQLLAQRAQVDGLTGLWNRAYFNQRWSQEHSRLDRRPGALSLAMIDLDHFKRINDRHGHPAGDQVLVGLSRILQRAGRQSDSACRYGGEEFALIMPDTSPRAAAAVCERIRAQVEALRWTASDDLRVTVSIGVVGSELPVGLPPQRWVELADQNLYGAKRSGRNRVVVTDLSTSAPVRLAG
jgi:two-component system, cell cycle response regulator